LAGLEHGRTIPLADIGCLARPRAASGQSCHQWWSSQGQGFKLCHARCRLSRRFLELLAGQDEEIIAELRILKVDFKQPFISYGQDLSVFYALDRHGSSVVRRKEAKFAHDAS